MILTPETRGVLLFISFFVVLFIFQLLADLLANKII